MPYAQQHYPFENKDIFEKNFPADFVSEGIDQTRGWFYTLLVLSTHLFGKAPWKNVIVTGLVLAEYVLQFLFGASHVLTTLCKRWEENVEEPEELP